MLVFWIPKKVRQKLSYDKEKAERYNEEIDKDESEYKKKKKLLFSGVYYNNIVALLLDNIGAYSSYISGTYLIYINIMPFIKVTFFSKLYLVELLLKYV